MRHGLLALAIVLLPATQVATASEWQVKPYFGATFGNSTTIVQPVGDTGSKLTLGVSSVWLGEVFGIEGDIGHTSGFFSNGSNLVQNSGVTTVTGNIVIALPRRLAEYTLRPYVVGGAGLMHVNLEDHVANTSPLQTGSDNLWAIDVGGGVTGFLTDRIGVSWDIRRFSVIGGQTGILVTIPAGSEQLSFWRANMSVAIRPIRRTRSTR